MVVRAKLLCHGDAGKRRVFRRRSDEKSNNVQTLEFFARWQLHVRRERLLWSARMPASFIELQLVRPVIKRGVFLRYRLSVPWLRFV